MFLIFLSNQYQRHITIIRIWECIIFYVRNKILERYGEWWIRVMVHGESET